MNARPFSLWLLALATLLAPRAARADKYVYVDVSFKILVKSSGETIPKSYDINGQPLYFNPAVAADVTEANRQADEMLSHATNLSINPMMDYSWRGLRYRRYGDVLFVKASDGDATFANRVDSTFRSSYPATFAGGQAYINYDPDGKLTVWGPADAVRWKWSTVAANFYLMGGFGGGVGYGGTNLMVQGGFWVNPATHELGHWFSLPHPFRVGGGQGTGVCYWADDAGTLDHGDGFTDTLLDHVGCTITLDDAAGRLYQNADNSPKTYSQLTAAEQTATRTWFRDFYAQQFFEISTYASLTAAQQLRIPAYDTSAPAPVNADRDRLAEHLYGVPYASLRADLAADIDAAVAAPFGSRWGTTPAKFLWLCKVDDDLIAEHNFNLFYDQTSAGQREQIRLLNANIMAYRAGKGSPYGILSEQQLDRMCDQISGIPFTNGGSDHRGSTRATVSGRYWFFGGPTTDSAAPLGSSRKSHTNIVNATTANAGLAANDIVIGRPGSYPVPGPNGTTLRLNKACTIRATRDGAFSIYGH